VGERRNWPLSTFSRLRYSEHFAEIILIVFTLSFGELEELEAEGDGVADGLALLDVSAIVATTST
jgi:hypothetical protein